MFHGYGLSPQRLWPHGSRRKLPLSPEGGRGGALRLPPLKWCLPPDAPPCPQLSTSTYPPPPDTLRSLYSRQAAETHRRTDAAPDPRRDPAWGLVTPRFAHE